MSLNDVVTTLNTNGVARNAAYSAAHADKNKDQRDQAFSQLLTQLLDGHNRHRQVPQDTGLSELSLRTSKQAVPAVAAITDSSVDLYA